MDLEKLIWSVVKPGPIWDWLVSPALNTNISPDMIRNSFAVRARSEPSEAEAILSKRNTRGPWELEFGWDADRDMPSSRTTGTATNFLYLPEFFNASYVLGVCYKDSMNSWMQMLAEYETDPEVLQQIDLSALHLSRFFLNLTDGNEFFSLCHLPAGYIGMILVRYDLDGEIEMNKVLFEKSAHPLEAPTKLLKVVRGVSACKQCLRSGMDMCYCPDILRAKSFSPSEVCVPSYTEFVRRARHMNSRRQRMQLLDPKLNYAPHDLGIVQTHDYFFGDSPHLRTMRDHYTAFVTAFRVDPLTDFGWFSELGLPTGMVAREEVERLDDDVAPFEDEPPALPCAISRAPCISIDTPFEQPLQPLVLAAEQSGKAIVSETTPLQIESCPPSVADIVKRELDISLLEKETISVGKRSAKRARVQCDECGQTFSKANNLSRHRATIHEGKRSFVCKQCDQTFNQRIHLQRHVAAKHTNERLFACDQCDKTFAIHNNLTRHVKAVHERARPFACVSCNSSFFDRADLRKHCRRKHGEKEPAVEPVVTVLTASP